ncbi:MAG: alpha/beta hydrolase [Candidatus Pacebacteria bacterium]|nr:alpha/beta hydrolase [Candidatus Paceibacterota bacterium]
MQKLTLQNRRDQNIIGILLKPEDNIIGTAVLQHGYGGAKENPHIQVIQDALLQNQFQVFNFDAPHSFGESEGKYEDARLGLHTDDFEDVANWVQEQEWFTGKLLVSGHSMGGFASARYALRNLEKVNFAIPFAPVVSGELSYATKRKFYPDLFSKWEKDGIQIRESKSVPGRIRKEPWQVMTEMLNHSLLKENNINPPMLLITCEFDHSCQHEHIKIFYDALSQDKEIKMLSDSSHTPREPEQLEELKNIIDTWLIKKLAES